MTLDAGLSVYNCPFFLGPETKCVVPKLRSRFASDQLGETSYVLVRVLSD
jgi:hypothetical protein